MPQSSQPAEVISYKPSAFYFRRAIRAAKSLAAAKVAARAVIQELEELEAWARGQGFTPVAVSDRCDALNRCAGLADAKALGLTAVLEIEDVKALVRSHGAIPPKWRVLPDEAEEKGWGRTH